MESFRSYGFRALNNCRIQLDSIVSISKEFNITTEVNFVLALHTHTYTVYVYIYILRQKSVVADIYQLVTLPPFYTRLRVKFGLRKGQLSMFFNILLGCFFVVRYLSGMDDFIPRCPKAP